MPYMYICNINTYIYIVHTHLWSRILTLTAEHVVLVTLSLSYYSIASQLQLHLQAVELLACLLLCTACYAFLAARE